MTVGDYQGGMDLPLPLLDLARAATLAQPLGSQATLSAAAEPNDPTGGDPDGERPGLGDAGHRDIVAAVIYYDGVRALLKDDEEALRAADFHQPMIGKYPVDRVLGSGGKGAVLLGRNPDLDEEVAIKVLRPDGPGDRRREGVRLLREGRILAKLVHPNIVPIHDAGFANGDHYIVMRCVRGTTLREAQVARPWPVIVDLYVQAGRGLAAVHDAGLIHRDFKAENVLVETDGRVMLADFGLVCLAHEEAMTGAAAMTHNRVFADGITKTGEIHGTPAYMAPEAFCGEPPSVASDLFSFAASLFEALHGERPFSGDNYYELVVAVTEGAIRPRRADSTVPPWLDEVVRGALAVEASQRPPTMRALLAALDYHARDRAAADSRARTRRWRWFSAAAVAAAIGGVVLGSIHGGANDPCAAPMQRLEGVWDATTRAQVADAGMAGERLAGLLDGQAAAWADTFTAVCTATYDAGTQSSELHDARMGCLDQRRRELVAIREMLTVSDPAHIDEALLAAAQLDSPRPCATAERTPQPRADQTEAVAALATELAGVRVRELGGEYSEGRALAEDLVARARAIGHAPLVAEALVAFGRACWLIGDGKSARTALAEAVDLAERHGLDTLAADAASLLTKLAALTLREPALGHEWARQAERKLSRTGGDDGRRADLINNRGLVAYELDTDYPRARALHEEALHLRQAQQADGDEARIRIAESHYNLGNVQSAQGELAGAIASYRESRRLHIDVLGPDHPQIGELLHAEASEHMKRGEFAEALARAEEALAILERKPAAALTLARVHHLLSAIHGYRHDLGASLRHVDQAMEIMAHVDGLHAGEIAEMHTRQGTVLGQLERPEEALVAFDAGLAALAKVPSPQPARRVALLFNRGELQNSLGYPDRALVDFAAVAEILRTGGPALAVYRPYLLKGIAAAHLAANRPADAVAPLQEALAGLPAEGEVALRTEIEFFLASALPRTERARARTLALAALETYESIPDEARAAEVRRWLAEHPKP